MSVVKLPASTYPAPRSYRRMQQLSVLPNARKAMAQPPRLKNMRIARPHASARTSLLLQHPQLVLQLAAPLLLPPLPLLEVAVRRPLELPQQVATQQQVHLALLLRLLLRIAVLKDFVWGRLVLDSWDWLWQDSLFRASDSSGMKFSEAT